jgi:hypothetical protein
MVTAGIAGAAGTSKPLSESRRRAVTEALVDAVIVPVENDREPGKPLVGSSRFVCDERKDTRDSLRADTSFIKLLWNLVPDETRNADLESGCFLLRTGQIWTVVRGKFGESRFQKKNLGGQMKTWLFNVRVETREEPLFKALLEACLSTRDLASAIGFPMELPDTAGAAADANGVDDTAAADGAAAAGGADTDVGGATHNNSPEEQLRTLQVLRVREMINVLNRFSQATTVVPDPPTERRGAGGRPRGGLGGVRGGAVGGGAEPPADDEADDDVRGGAAAAADTEERAPAPSSPKLRPDTVALSLKRGPATVVLDCLEKNASPIAGDKQAAGVFRGQLKKAKVLLEKELEKRAERPGDSGSLSAPAQELLDYMSILSAPKLKSAIEHTQKEQKLLRDAHPPVQPQQPDVEVVGGDVPPPGGAPAAATA